MAYSFPGLANAEVEQTRQTSAALLSTCSPSWVQCSLLQTPEGEETTLAEVSDDVENHLLSSERGSYADKQALEDMKTDLLLPSPTGTSRGGSRPLLDYAMMRHS